MGRLSSSTIGLGVYGAELALARAGALPFRPSRAAFGGGGHGGDMHAVYQYIDDRNILPGNNGQNELLGAGNLAVVTPGEDSRFSMPSSASTGCCPSERWEHRWQGRLFRTCPTTVRMVLSRSSL